jgi:hypothetical protein
MRRLDNADFRWHEPLDLAIQREQDLLQGDRQIPVQSADVPIR